MHDQWAERPAIEWEIAIKYSLIAQTFSDLLQKEASWLLVGTQVWHGA